MVFWVGGVHVRRVSLSLLVVYAVVATAAGAAAAEASGSFGKPFREDLAKFTLPSAGLPNGLFKGASRDDTGCKVGPDGKKDCLPAGASMVSLANGDVLYWNAIEGEEDIKYNAVLEGGALASNGQSRILRMRSAPRWLRPSPIDGGAKNSGPAAPLIPGLKNDEGKVNDGDLFCSDQKLLADGRVIAVGGTDWYHDPAINDQYGVLELEGVKNARIYSSKSNTWKQAASMNFGRWYPSLVTLGNGKLFVASGVTKLIKPMYLDRPMDSGRNVTQTETYDPKTNKWTDNTKGNADSARSLPLFPRLHLLPNGNVYYDAAGQAYNPQGQAYDEALWNIAAVYDPKTNAWRDLGIPMSGLFSGFRGSTFSAVLPLKPPYKSASFLTGGGVLLPTPGSYFPVANTRITTVTGAAGQESLETVSAGDMGRSRWFSTAVPLPDGTVLALSGGDLDEVVSPGFEQPIRTAEIFTPTYDPKGNVVGGSWKDAGIGFRGRTYHNNAVLMPDGRVLVGGHAPILRAYSSNGEAINTPVREFSNNYKDASFEVYTPPYLSRGSRPVLGSLGSTLKRGKTLTIPLKNVKGSGIHNAVLIRNTAQTHLVDADARVVELRIVRRTASSITVAVPSSANVLTSGPYRLFVNRKTSKGPVPSVGHQFLVN